MNIKTWIPLVLAVALGLVAMVVARKALFHGPATDAVGKTVPVVMVARDVPPGRVITPEDVRVVTVTAELGSDRTFRTPNDVVGRAPQSQLVKGQTVVESLLAAPGQSGVSVLVPGGMRAMTLEVNEFTGLAGMLVPGSRVDVIAVVRDDKANQSVARTLLQNLKVLAVGRQITPGPTAPPPGGDGAPQPPAANNVTLLVSNKQAQVLQLAGQGGRPWLVLRSGLDTAEVSAEPVGLNDLRQGLSGPLMPVPVMATTTAPTTNPSDAFAPVLASRPAARIVKIYRNGAESEVSFPATPVAVSPPAESQSTPPPLKPQPDGPVMTGNDTSEVIPK